MHASSVRYFILTLYLSNTSKYSYLLLQYHYKRITSPTLPLGENGGDGGLLEDDDNDTHDEDGDVRYQEDGEHDDGWETLDDDDQDTHDEDGNQEGGGDHTSMYHPSSPDVSQMSEEEQVRMATRLGLIEQLPTGVYRGSMEKRRECVICLVEFRSGDPLRYLPCMHFYHAACVDEWLVRSLTCPSCMEPADANLLVSFVTEE